MFLYYIFVFIFGTIIGSFINALTYRYGTSLSLFSRSRCFSCDKQLRWYELIPILSYAVLRGKCSNCKSKISFQYPIVEGINGALFLLLFVEMMPFYSGRELIIFSLYLSVISIFVAISVYDLRHKIIPDGFVIALSIVSLLIAYLLGPVFLEHLLAGIILPLPFAALWLVSSGRWMGLGDAKLMIPIGLLLGITYGISAMVIAFWSGALVGLSLIFFSSIKKRRLSNVPGALTMKSEMPFAPFLILGALLVLFFNINLFELFVLV